MAEKTPQRLNLNAMKFAHDDVMDEGTKAIRYLTSRICKKPKATQGFVQLSMNKCAHELSFPTFHKKELALWNEGNRQ